MNQGNTEYKVLRHINFFAVTNVVSASKLNQFYTTKAIESFITYGFIEKLIK